MEFLGGAYVFPGGTVKKNDYSEGMLQRCHGLSRQEAKKILGGDLGPELALGHWVAGIRELFEEAGIVICVTESGERVPMKENHLRESLAEKRKGLIEKSIDFRTILESERLLCDSSRLAYFSHWLTPEEFATRFDTRFYLALLPSDQIPLFTSEEVVHSLWITPENALKLSQEGGLPIIFPTYSALRMLADFDSLESLLAEYLLGSEFSL